MARIWVAKRMDAKKTVFDAKDLHLSSRLSHPLSVCMHTNIRRESSVGVLNLLFRSFNTPTHTHQICTQHFGSSFFC